MEKIGFIGLGIMGRPIALNLLKNGTDLTVFDVNPAACEPLVAAGAKKADSLIKLAENCDIIMMIVPNAAIVESILFDENGLAGILHAGQLVCDLSSLNPQQSQSISKKFSERCGAEYVDAPISGGEVKAISGQLTIMMGGSEEQFKRMSPYFSFIGANWNRMGGVGKGSLTKLCNQIIVTSNIAAVCEATALAEKNNMDLNLLFNVLKDGSANSFMMTSRIGKITNRDFTPGGPIATHLKDIRNVLSEGKELGVDLPISTVLEKMLAENNDDGNSRCDSSSLLLWYEKKFGITIE